MNIALIDLGTNMFSLLICDISKSFLTYVFKEQIATYIGKGGIEDKILLPDAFIRSYQAFDSFQESILKYNCEKIIAIGTSALRNAKNADEFCSQILNRYGINIQIINGEDEAFYIYKGNSQAISLKNKSCLILDIGGGSVECIISKNNELAWKKSYEIGVQRLISKFTPTSPLTSQVISEVTKLFDNEFTELHTACRTFGVDCLIGSSGVFDTFRNILETSKLTTPAYTFNTTNLVSLLDKLMTLEKFEIESISGMHKHRIESIAIASLLTKYIISSAGITSVIQSNYSLIEGVISTVVSKE